MRKLEDYAKGNPKAADAQFLLGYQYLTAGHLPQATEAFGKASKLQPADTVAKQLYELCKESSDGDEPAGEGEPDPAPTSGDSQDIPAPTIDQLTGNWEADKGDKGTITLSISEDQAFTWTFKKGDDENVLKGEAVIDQGLLVLGADGSQMVGAVTFSDEDKNMNFVIAGGPDGDPGLDFVKKG